MNIKEKSAASSAHYFGVCLLAPVPRLRLRSLSGLFCYSSSKLTNLLLALLVAAVLAFVIVIVIFACWNFSGYLLCSLHLVSLITLDLTNYCVHRVTLDLTKGAHIRTR